MPSSPPTDLHRVYERADRAIAAIRAGQIVILVDDEDRENEGDLCMAAEWVTPEAINFMATHGRGLICVTLTEEQVARLDLPMMQPAGRAGPPLGTAFTVSIEARRGVTTGISSADRARTIRVAAEATTRPEDIVTPGHVFPLRARSGGVLVRAGQTEGSVDLARLAGLTPAGVICEIMNDDGTMARLPDLERFAARHGLVLVSVADLIHYRLRMDRLLRRVQEAAVQLDAAGAAWRVIVYESLVDKRQFLALVKGQWAVTDAVLVRMHAGSLLGDLFLATAEPSGGPLRGAMGAIDRAGAGVIVYFPTRVSPADELVARDATTTVPGLESAPAVLHEYGLGAQILADLGVRKMRLLTNSPRKLVGLAGFGLEVAECVPLTSSVQKES